MDELYKLRPNIAFAGLTAAGKTTHARLVAQELGYTYISATEVMLDILQFRGTDPNRAWLDNYNEIEKAREGDRADIELETRMTKLSNSQDGLVLDTWAMAWIYSGPTPMVRLWIESNESSRTRKCYVSQGNNKDRDLKECRQLINQKDGDTRMKFQRRLSFDLFTDRSRYNVILDNSRLIPEATTEVAQRGIATFAPIVLEAVKYCINSLVTSSFDENTEKAHRLVEDSHGMIQHIGAMAQELNA